MVIDIDILWLLMAITVALCLLYRTFWNVFILPKKMIRQTTKCIVEKLNSVSGDFVIYESTITKGTYVLLDKKRKTETFVHWSHTYKYPIVKGDLDWMNEWEKKLLLKTVDNVLRKEKEKINEEERASVKKRYEEARQAYIDS